MSASPTARQAYSQAIPVTKRVLISDPNQMPDIYSQTPGGTLYSTTPGGTRLIYERNFMKNLRNSPMSQTPPNNIPSCLMRGAPKTPFRKCVPAPEPITKNPMKIEDHQEQFQLEL